MTERARGHWPGDVEPIGIEEFEKLGINTKNELFWDGRRLITGRRFYLTAPQSVLAILAALASLATIATGVNNASLFLCARDIRWMSCPQQPGLPPPLPAPHSPGPPT